VSHLKDTEGNPVGELAWSDIFNVIRDTPGSPQKRRPFAAKWFASRPGSS